MHAVQPHLSSELNLAEFQGALSAVARSGAAGRSLQLLYPSSPDAHAGGHGGKVPRSEDRRRSSGQARPARSGSVGGLSKDVPPEAIPAGLGKRVRTLRAILDEAVPLPRYVPVLQGDA